MYQAQTDRYDNMPYRRCGKSGIDLPEISLGLWHNFGDGHSQDLQREMIHRAFDLGITHFDLANNYGPPYGSAEQHFGEIMSRDLHVYRDELFISTKAGWDMWPGPYGNFGSRKYLIASLDQSLKRMGLDYVDVFYHHRPDPHTPLQETMGALESIVKSGRALYVGISQYSAEQTKQAVEILSEKGIDLLIHQPRYNLFDRWIEADLLETLEQTGTGCIVFSPLAQGMLTSKYLKGIPQGSRASQADSYLKPDQLDDKRMHKVKALNDLAAERGDTLAQMAVNWTLRIPVVTSALIGASRPEQIDELVRGRDSVPLSSTELDKIETILAD